MMRTTLLAFASILAVVASGMSASAQPEAAVRPSVQIAAPPAADRVAGAREIVRLMYHDDGSGGMEDWLFETLMDRYRRAFDLADSVDDPAIKSAIHDELSAVQPKLHLIVARHLDEVRNGAVQEITFTFPGEQLGDLIAFAHTPGGQTYMNRYPVLASQRYYMRGLVADNVRLAGEIAAELARRAPRYSASHPEMALAVYSAASSVQ